jgi:hypothetical protein
MDLPFALNEEEKEDIPITTILPSSSHSYSNVTTTSNGSVLSSVTPQHSMHHRIVGNNTQDIQMQDEMSTSTTILPGGGTTTMYDNIHQHFYSIPNNTSGSSHGYKTKERSTSLSTAYEMEPLEFISDFVDVCQVDKEEESSYDSGMYRGLIQDHYSSWNTQQIDILSLLLSHTHDDLSPSTQGLESKGGGDLVTLIEQATWNANQAIHHTKQNDISQAAASHYDASKLYKDAATILRGKNDLDVLSYSLLVMSNAQARSADSLVKHGGIVKGNECFLGKVGKETSSATSSCSINPTSSITSAHHKEERLRAKIRASMGTAEKDMNESVFLGKVPTTSTKPPLSTSINPVETNLIHASKSSNTNAVDDMMELEKELREMDAALDMGVKMSASVSSLTTKKTLDSSYMVVPGASSYMSSSVMWSSPGSVSSRQNQHQHHHHSTIPLNGRARANRVQTMLDASTSGFQRLPNVGSHSSLHQNPIHSNQSLMSPKIQQNQNGLESSWWGGSSVLAASTASLSNSMVGVQPNVGNQAHYTASSQANTKQLMRLLDSLKTLGDENASLLREVEEAKKARLEAKAARAEVNRFKEEYNRRFATLKAALQKSNQMTDQTSPGATVPSVISTSKFVKSQTSAEIEKRDKMIQKLQAELKQEKMNSKKKDDALRKYENFYKEVKARSEQKKRQKEAEQNARR